MSHTGRSQGRRSVFPRRTEHPSPGPRVHTRRRDAVRARLDIERRSATYAATGARSRTIVGRSTYRRSACALSGRSERAVWAWCWPRRAGAGRARYVRCAIGRRSDDRARILDSAGRRCSPATFPCYHVARRRATRAARPGRPADGRADRRGHAPHREHRHGWRLRALIVVLWRGGLRIHEALGLTENDLDPRRGSLLVRTGKVGSAASSAWTSGAGSSAPMPAARPSCRRAAVLHHRRRHRGGRGRALGYAASCAGSRPEAGVWCCSRGTSCATRTRSSSPARASAQHHPARTRPHQPRHHLDLPARHRPRRDHRRRSRWPRPDDVRQRRAGT